MTGRLVTTPPSRRGRGRGLRHAALVALLLLAAAAAARGDALQDLSRDFWVWRAANQPVSGDDVPRIERPTDWTPDWTRAAVERRRREIESFERRILNIDASGMPVAWQVDRRLLRSAFARVRWELDVERGWERNPDFYVDQTLGAVFDRLVAPPPFSKVRSEEIRRRLESIPATLASAKGNLAGAQAPFARLAISRLVGVRPKLSEAVRDLKPLLDRASAGLLDASAERAIVALEEFRGWLENRAPTLPAPSAVGREGYVFFLRQVALLPYSPEEILAMGRQEWARAAALETFEEARNTGVQALAVAPDVATEIARAAREEAAVRAFLKDRSLLTVPDTILPYRLAPLPRYLELLGEFGEQDDFGSDSRPGDAVRYVPAPSPALGYFALSMARDPRPMIVHEGIPGHAFQLALSRANDDPIRRRYYDSSANEGIGFYAEEMMLAAGFFDDSPRTREIVANLMRLRALRVEADVRLALGELTIAQAADYLAKTVPMDPETAREEAARFAATPGQAISYQIGKLQILRLLADARRVQGEKFSLRAFHDFLWKNGNVPLALQRWEMVGLRDEIDLLDRSPQNSR